MEPPKFTPAEFNELVAQGELWMRQQRDSFHPRSVTLTVDQKRDLAPFFPAEILERFRIFDISGIEVTIPYPPFYERVRAGGFRQVPDAAHLTAVPFIDVAVFNRPPTLRTIFHNMVHVTQYAIVGVHKITAGYFSVLNEAGTWMVAPAEVQAYSLDARFTEDPSKTFSVAAEIEDWLRQGKFELPQNSSHSSHG